MTRFTLWIIYTYTYNLSITLLERINIPSQWNEWEEFLLRIKLIKKEFFLELKKNIGLERLRLSNIFISQEMKEIKKDKENISFEIPIGNIHEILFVTSRQKLFFFFFIHLIHGLKDTIPRFTRNIVIYRSISTVHTSFMRISPNKILREYIRCFHIARGLPLRGYSSRWRQISTSRFSWDLVFLLVEIEKRIDPFLSNRKRERMRNRKKFLRTLCRHHRSDLFLFFLIEISANSHCFFNAYTYYYY